ncbi:MAG: carbohydrate ABC transporter permease [Lachnospiraceae bacterium]|nr:carbohydrate ABC transporter permease [Lachnospiraceae bacterium]MDD7701827.1 carbohydrate ABC transporter permease [Lachnospiraceae bacterium]MDY3301213.1 carbohydrate ABC transporter permease [Lachnospiraceae bacterium]
MNENKSKGINIVVRRIIAYVVLVILTILCLVWFYLLFVNSTRSKGELISGFTPLPSTHFIKNWNGMLHSTQPIVRGMLNSVFVAACSAALCTYFSTMTAYAIHTYRFKARKAALTFILAVMMIPTQVTALGFIQLITKMGLMDNYIPLIIPAIAAPATFFYMKQYMDSVLSMSLVEAARIDGAGELMIFNRVALPLMKPAIAVQAIFGFVANWNNYFTPALVLKEEELKTLPVLIAELRNADFMKFDMGIVYMTIAFSIFPVIIVYLLLSKNIVGGVTLGGVKE